MKVKIHDTTYIFLLLSFVSGYFEYIFLLLLVIFIHESGHYFFSLLMNIKVKEIVIYPLGGITELNSDLNVPIYKEIVFLLGGIVFQLIFWFLIFLLYKRNLITNHIFVLLNKINILLISYNFMPIIPLDGGKLINNIMDIKIKYLVSNKISVFISLIFIFAFVFKFHTVLSYVIVIYLFKSLYIEYKNIYCKYIMFLYERVKNKYSFKKIKYIKNINSFYRGYYHYINSVPEEKILVEMFTIYRK